MRIYTACFKSSILDLGIVTFVSAYWSWSSIFWIIITTTVVWAIRIILNVFLRKRFARVVKKLKNKIIEKDDTKNI